MTKESLLFPFFLAFSSFLCLTIFFPNIRLLPFAPFLALALHKRPFYPLLWIGISCGLLYDLTCSDTRFGFYALEFSLTLALLYSFKRYFFYLPLTAAVFSFIASIFHLILLSFFKTSLAGAPLALVGNLLSMAIADGFFAFFWFTCPLFLYNRRRTVRWKYQN